LQCATLNQFIPSAALVRSSRCCDTPQHTATNCNTLHTRLAALKGRHQGQMASVTTYPTFIENLERKLFQKLEVQAQRCRLTETWQKRLTSLSFELWNAGEG